MRTARFWVPSCALLLLHCSSGNPGIGGPDSSLGGSNASTGGASRHSAGSGNPANGGTPNINLGGSNPGDHAGNAGSQNVDTSGCGDGLLQKAALGEVCDDGNSVSGDGCAADCMAVEANYACLKPGTPCESTVVCGDDQVTGAETCDDGNAKPHDGCDDSCQLEPGYICPTPGDACQ